MSAEQKFRISLVAWLFGLSAMVILEGCQLSYECHRLKADIARTNADFDELSTQIKRDNQIQDIREVIVAKEKLLADARDKLDTKNLTVRSAAQVGQLIGEIEQEIANLNRSILDVREGNRD